MKRIYTYLFLLGAFCLSACTTNVGVESSRHSIAIYNSINGNFDGYVDGNLMTVFNATNKALDALGYVRTAQQVRHNNAVVVARATLDAKIEVKMLEVQAGLMKVVVNYDGGNLMKSQEIFNAITRFSKSTSM